MSIILYANCIYNRYRLVQRELNYSISNSMIYEYYVIINYVYLDMTPNKVYIVFHLSERKGKTILCYLYCILDKLV